jgi:hypothetical protein
MITRLMPNGSAQLFGLTSMMKTETALAVEHGYFSKTMLFPSVTLGAAVADGVATTFTVVSSADMIPGMLLQADSTKEIVIVNTVPTSGSITVTRGVGGGAAAIANGVVLYHIGNAFEEASLRPNAMAIPPVRINNLTQIFRDTWAISGSAAATAVIAGDSPEAENRQDCAAFHSAAIEKALFFNKKSTSTRNSKPFRTMDGILNTLQTSAYSASNITTLGATTNYTQLEAAIDPVFNQTTDPKGARERVMFVGGTAKKVINNIGRTNGQYQLVDGQTNWGMEFSTFTLSRGTIRVIEHPMLNTNATWSKMGFVVDLPTFNLAYLNGRKTQNKEFNSSGNQAADDGIDAVGGTLTTEMTCVVKNPPANAIIYNLTAAAAG